MFNHEDGFWIRFGIGLLAILLGFLALPFVFLFPWAIWYWGPLPLAGIIFNGLAGWLLFLTNLQNLQDDNFLGGMDPIVIYGDVFFYWQELIHIPIYLAFLGASLAALLGWFIKKYNGWSVAILFLFALIALNPPFICLVIQFAYKLNL